MATFVRRALERRADDDDDDNFRESESWDNDDVTWWYSKEGYIVKWVILGVIVLLFTLWIVGGYWHAKKRIEKGLRPLAYHRCFVSRRMMARVDPRYAYPPQPYYAGYPPPEGYYQHGQPGGYPMYHMPPPVYDPSRPPMYDGPPEGGSKIDPAQGQTRRDDGPADYNPPPGPPPAR
ncbi:Chitin synthesis regulation Congo red resistance RCR [Fusarium albosuccineum]|uniref:Chitin synthesis regulation Congo red resistance RCR n=1 Tax=Fusarium albosuccineum TaxID=1237068 RepID=A0A8H4LCA5_9HYPO|nr:Chitin synthesis regulation Congo red resistance RCR [Fusarium albosuccineum]